MNIITGYLSATDGTVTITVDRLSIFSIVVDESTIPADGGVATDTSATAPATDVNSAAVAGVTVAAIAGAGVVAVALRKKVSE